MYKFTVPTLPHYIWRGPCLTIRTNLFKAAMDEIFKRLNVKNGRFNYIQNMNTSEILGCLADYGKAVVYTQFGEMIAIEKLEVRG